MKKKLLTILMFSLIFSISCKNSKGPTVKVDNFSNGKAGEVILIMDHHQWNEEKRERVKEVLTQPQPAINQIEPLFDILDFQPSDFTANFQRHRNIVRFDLNPDYGVNSLKIDQNTWSSPQIYVYIKANHVDSALQLFLNNQDEIIRALYDNDLKRVQSFYARDVDKNTERAIRKKFGIHLSVPHQYFIAKEESDFLWLRFRTARNDRFIMIYKTPAGPLSDSFLMNVRDSVTKKHIPGSVRGAYPIIARKFGFPIINPLTIGKREGVEMRGLWESVNDKMGGPFYSFSFLTPDGNHYITVDGFVYAPQEDKRDYLREVEAIVKSIR